MPLPTHQAHRERTATCALKIRITPRGPQREAIVICHDYDVRVLILKFINKIGIGSRLYNYREAPSISHLYGALINAI